MPELPDITVYCEALAERVLGRALVRARIYSPALLRTYAKPLASLEARRVAAVERMGKRIVVRFDDDSALVIHLMVAGRLLWSEGQPKGVRPGGKSTLATFEFEGGTLQLTEASTKHRAGLWIVANSDELSELNTGGVEPLECSLAQFAEALRRENRTLKRGLANPRAFSGIGNAYSDEILFAARLSPVRLTRALNDDEVQRLHAATQTVLRDSTDRLRAELNGKFPGRGQVTAFRPEFAVHGKFGLPCPVCGMPVQRIRYAENETNYCARCQNDGRLLADRALSILLKGDWPKTLDELMSD